jgi:hypothetical protein
MIDKDRAWETFKLTFCIIGVAGYTGYISSMTLFFRIISLISVCGLLSGIYSMTTKENELVADSEVSKISKSPLTHSGCVSTGTRNSATREVQPFSERERTRTFRTEQEDSPSQPWYTSDRQRRSVTQ